MGPAQGATIVDNRPRYSTFSEAKKALSSELREIRTEIKERHGAKMGVTFEPALSAIKASSLARTIRVYFNGGVYYTSLSIVQEH
jgi:hypothetical protein